VGWGPLEVCSTMRRRRAVPVCGVPRWLAAAGCGVATLICAVAASAADSTTSPPAGPPPGLIHGQYFGWGSRLRMFHYPSADTQWSIAGGLKQRVAGVDAFATHLSIEVAPFLDVGKVFAATGESPLSHLHKGAGIGIRGVASPFVVGYLDVGYGHDKAAVFSGLSYPF
jgi:hypothetical protein